MKPNRYRNVFTEVDGIRFHSKKEANRYCELKQLQKAGAISGLVLQPSWDIVVEGTKVCRVIYDFRYEQYGSIVLEDVKSAITRRDPVYRLKKKLFEATHNIQVTEV